MHTQNTYLLEKLGSHVHDPCDVNGGGGGTFSPPCDDDDRSGTHTCSSGGTAALRCRKRSVAHPNWHLPVMSFTVTS